MAGHVHIEIHPIFVHFPIALVVVALLFDWGRWIFSRGRLLEAGFWGGTTMLLIAALIGACISVATGLLAQNSAPKSEAVRDLIESHETMAFVATGLLALLVFWRIALRGQFPRSLAYLYLGVLLLVTVVLGYGAYLGGVMVFSHGVGVGIAP